MRDLGRPTLPGDQRGILLLTGLFMALFLCGMLYYVHGLAETMLVRERMQDATDAAAFTGAVVHARGMNTLALINIVMSMLLALLVAMRLAVVIGTFVTLLLMGLAFVTGGATAAPAAAVGKATRALNTASQKMKPRVDGSITALHKAGDGVRIMTPMASMGRSAWVAEKGYGEVIGGAVSIPRRFTLPAQPGAWPRLCHEAGQRVNDAIWKPLEWLGIKEEGSGSALAAADEAVGSAITSLTDAAPGWFCGDGKGPAPIPERKLDQRRPRTQLQDQCDQQLANFSSGVGDAEDNHERAMRSCALARLEALAAIPNQRGECRAGRPICDPGCVGTGCPIAPRSRFDDCDELLSNPDLQDEDLWVRCDSEAAPYHRILARSRQKASCDHSDRHKNFEWIQVKVERTYRWTTQPPNQNPGWVLVGETPLGELEFPRGQAGHPCAEVDAWKISRQWDSEEPDPVCELGHRCSTGSGSIEVQGRCRLESGGVRQSQRLEGQVHIESFVRVLEVLGCSAETTMPASTYPGQNLSGPDDKQVANQKKKGGLHKVKLPFEIEDDLEFGQDAFQQRAVALRASYETWGGNALGKLASVPKSTGGLTVGAMYMASRFSASQAEYYFDLDHGELPTREQWLWHQGWTARLRRMTIPEFDDSPQAQDREQRQKDEVLDLLGSDSLPDGGCASLANKAPPGICGGDWGFLAEDTLDGT